MFYRKITSSMERWFESQKDKKTALVIEGLRQTGKTTSILDFLRSHYKHVNVINFKDSPSFKELFQKADLDMGIDTLFQNLSALLPESDFTSPGSVLFLDEIQECGRARYAMKPILSKTNLHVVASGSLLGVRGYNREISGDIPTGSETILTLHSMDFEEFLLAMGEKPSTLDLLRLYYKRGEMIPTPIHEKMLSLFRQYLVVGGLPEVVGIFAKSHNLKEVLIKQRSLIAEYRGDFGRYVDGNGMIRVDYSLQGKLNTLLDSAPVALAKEPNRFIFKDLPGSPRKDAYEYALDWLCQFGLLAKCKRLEQIALPLKGYANPSLFKIYFQDTGLFIASLDDGAQEHVIKGELGTYKGAIYENIVADALLKKNQSLYYFANQNGLEIDFVVEFDGEPAIVEVKAKGGHTKSAITVLNDKEKYHVNRCLKLSANNIGSEGNVLTLPYYLTSLVF